MLTTKYLFLWFRFLPIWVDRRWLVCYPFVTRTQNLNFTNFFQCMRYLFHFNSRKKDTRERTHLGKRPKNFRPLFPEITGFTKLRKEDSVQRRDRTLCEINSKIWNIRKEITGMSPFLKTQSKRQSKWNLWPGEIREDLLRSHPSCH